MKLYYGLTFEKYEELFSESFGKFFDHLLIDEGGYVSGKQARKIKDRGGATKFGISLAFLLSIGIQREDLEADGDINNDGVVDENDIVCLTKEQAKILYFKYFYNPLYELIQSKEVANRIFNFGVNAGKRTSVLVLQRTVNQVLKANVLKVDGIFGKNTLDAVNGIIANKLHLVPGNLYDSYIINIELFYRGLKKPNFIMGWLNRLRRKLNWT